MRINKIFLFFFLLLFLCCGSLFFCCFRLRLCLCLRLSSWLRFWFCYWLRCHLFLHGRNFFYHHFCLYNNFCRRCYLSFCYHFWHLCDYFNNFLYFWAGFFHFF